MPVVALGDYKFVAKDTVDKFHGNQLLYIGWDQHLMFCAPVAFPFPANLVFGEIPKIMDNPGCFGYHPDYAKIDWDAVTWLKSGQPFKPDFSKSLAENGLKHKDSLRFCTPGLTGIKGSSS